MEKETDGRTLDALETTLDIIDTVQELEGATLGDLTEELALPKSTIYYHVNTLRAHGYLVEEDGKYYIGLRFFSHGAHAKRRREEYSIIDTKLQDLAEETTAETDFAVEENGRLIVLAQRISGSNRSGFLEGSYLYLTASSAGKAILAEMEDEQINAVLKRWGLPKVTDHTITDKDKLFEEISEVREQGYAVNDEELMSGLRSVSAVIHDSQGSVLGAISVSGPKYRFTMDTIEGQIIGSLQQTIDEIEAEIASIERSQDS